MIGREWIRVLLAAWCAFGMTWNSAVANGEGESETTGCEAENVPAFIVERLDAVTDALREAGELPPEGAAPEIILPQVPRGRLRSQVHSGPLSDKYDITFFKNVYVPTATTPRSGPYIDTSGPNPVRFQLTGLTVDSAGNVYAVNDPADACQFLPSSQFNPPLVFKVTPTGSRTVFASWRSLIEEPFILAHTDGISNEYDKIAKVINGLARGNYYYSGCPGFLPANGPWNIELRGAAAASNGDLLVVDPFLNTIFRLGPSVDGLGQSNDVGVYVSNHLELERKLSDEITFFPLPNGCISDPVPVNCEQCIIPDNPDNTSSGHMYFTETEDDYPILGMTVHVSFRHSRPGDVVLLLTHVDTGTTEILRQNVPEASTLVTTTYSAVTRFNGQSTLGTWELHALDTVPGPADPDNYLRCFWIEFKTFNAISGLTSTTLNGPTNLVFEKDNAGNTSRLFVANSMNRTIVRLDPDSPVDGDHFPESVALHSASIPGPTIDPWEVYVANKPLNFGQGFAFGMTGRATSINNLYYVDPYIGLYRIANSGAATLLSSQHRGACAWEVGPTGTGGDELLITRAHFDDPITMEVEQTDLFDALTFNAQTGQISSVGLGGYGFSPPLLLASDPNNGALYAAETGTGNLYKLTPKAVAPDEDIIMTNAVHTLQSLSQLIAGPAIQGELTLSAAINSLDPRWETWIASGNLEVNGRLAQLRMGPRQRLLFKDGKELRVVNDGRLRFIGKSEFEGASAAVPAEACMLSSLSAVETLLTNPSVNRRSLVGRWKGIRFVGPAVGQSTLFAVYVEFAEYGINAVDVPAPAVNRGSYTEYTSFLDIRFSAFRDCRAGIYALGSAPLIYASRIYNNRVFVSNNTTDPRSGAGIVIENSVRNVARPMIVNSDIYGNDNVGVFIWPRQRQSSGPSPGLGATATARNVMNFIDNFGFNNFYGNGSILAQLNLWNGSDRTQTAQANYWGITAAQVPVFVDPAVIIDGVISDDDELPTIQGRVDFSSYSLVPHSKTTLNTLGNQTALPASAWELYD